eukprot:CAMPEP_0206475892 /NCGR_PEP_ID=MMETSP0324_2-20121206/34369_1 /ASSEMBLY_ACC=CAM_ASM_000836 /TAXON_ID=2866 /ORGANISM="Crypthecodinium cohnii, Strain Seligo" /LENGTH=79 /DNA_ID=CAMNT_0053951375 /DNA_START=434 /DNA_END=674 /DNA_ORIENTATION=+
MRAAPVGFLGGCATLEDAIELRLPACTLARALGRPPILLSDEDFRASLRSARDEIPGSLGEEEGSGGLEGSRGRRSLRA